ALALLVLTRGRGYYAAAAYPVLLAAGAVQAERWVAGLAPARRRSARALAAALLALGAVAVLVPGPFFPIDSAPGRVATQVNGGLREQLGGPGLGGTTADVYAALPVEERARAGVLVGNYGEGGALSLDGPARGLPAPISGVNSFWERGYGDPPPET